MLKRLLFFVYGLTCYAIFLGTFLYAIAFVGGFFVSRRLDGTLETSLPRADLKRSNKLRAGDVEDVHCDVFQGAFEFAGGGGFGPKDHPQVKEQGDYNLKYLIAAALLDDQLGPAQLEEARIQAPDVQALLMRVDIHPNERFSSRYPQELSARVSIRTRDKRVFVREQNGYEGGLTNPMSWERTVEKFHWLAEPFADEELRKRLIGAVQQLDTLRLSDLTDLLAQVQPIAVFPTTHRGIQ